MVDTQQLRDAFAARLNAALDDMPNVRRGRGRNIDLQRGLHEAGVVTTTQATSKWLRAESMPEKDNMVALAQWLLVRAEWLEYGDGPMRPVGQAELSELRAPYANEISRLALLATPRSYEVLLRIAQAAEQGRLTEEDIDLLDRIASRFEGANKTPLPDNKGSHSRLRDKLKSHDRDTEK